MCCSRFVARPISVLDFFLLIARGLASPGRPGCLCISASSLCPLGQGVPPQKKKGLSPAHFPLGSVQGKSKNRETRLLEALQEAFIGVVKGLWA